LTLIIRRHQSIQVFREH